MSPRALQSPHNLVEQESQQREVEPRASPRSTRLQHAKEHRASDGVVMAPGARYPEEDLGVMRDEPTQRAKPAGKSGSGPGEQAQPVVALESLASKPADKRDRPAGGAVRADQLSRGNAIDRYVILELLGQGGMGVVYAAYDPDLDRKVALKVLRATGGAEEDTDGRARMVREAQALARLSHPNVVAVYDVGDTGDGVWIAMEYVDGPSLKQWLKAEARSWRDVVALFRKAGRGLAVAHERDVVHRDVKPDNIFLWRDGRVCIGDFGLASVRGNAIKPDVSKLDDAALAEAKPITRTGMVMGTPPYMPPEQLHGHPADARSDQFSFSVALYEALYGERPFAGDTLLALREEVDAGHVREAPAGTRVPAWVRRVVVRGLAADPERRYPSMAAMLDELGRDPRRTRRRLVAAGGVLAIIATAITGVAIGAVPGVGGALCEGGAAEMDGVWNRERADAIRTVFRESGAPEADEAWRRVSQKLDAYRDEWVAMHRDACEATHVRGEQSERLLDLRMACLDRRRVEVGELVKLFSEADAALVRRSIEAASSISGLEDCADIEALTADGPRPASPEQRDRLSALGERLARARAYHRAGRYADALDRARSIADSADELGYDPFTAKAYMFLGTMQRLAGHYDDAEASLFEAVVTAEASGADRTTAWAWTDLALVVGRDLARPDQGLRYARVAEAAIERAGSPPQLLSQLHNNRGAVLASKGELEASEAEYKKALVIDAATLEPDDPDRAITLTSLGNAAYRLGHYQDARAHYQEALAIREAAFGPGHPAVAESKISVGLALEAQGEPEAALASYQAGLEINARVFGSDSMPVANSLSSLGGAYHALGRHGKALDANRRALAIRLRVLGDMHPDVAQNYNNIAIAQKNLGHFDEAQDAYEKAIHILEAGGDDSRFGLGIALNNLGEAARAEGDFDEAISAYQRSLDTLSEVIADDNPLFAHPLTGLGIAYLEGGQLAKARPLLERALKLRQAQKISPADLADTSFGLARVLWRQGRDRKRALSLAHTARDAFAEAGEARADDRDAVANWLATR